MTNERQPYVIKAKDVTTAHEIYIHNHDGTYSWVELRNAVLASDPEWVRFEPASGFWTAHVESFQIVRDKAPEPKTLREKLTEAMRAATDKAFDGQFLADQRAAEIAADYVLEVFAAHFDETCKRLWPTEIAADWELERVQALRAELFGDKR